MPVSLRRELTTGPALRRVIEGLKGQGTTERPAGLSDLQPYLGAAGHVVVMRGDGTRFGHRHAETFDDQGRPVAAMPGTTFGPELDLHITFQVGGTYRLWAQFRLADGTVVTAPFTVHTTDQGTEQSH